ncbi:hypothetical protein B6V73_07170 [Thioclava sp. JM3]|uniref:HlyD family secretion protein n=1 Tax=Thioclava sp. JM3 TaxID=1973004 RepID=UPI000B541A78|nr:HlyD family efflux transporter periplasmic adaptor subunit [Thioclava sp. JM3]OWY17443.1 hypothetical protein B6V73_07170 [Thioclava sp. JM3]
MLDTILAWISALLAAIIPGYGDAPMPHYSGYVEGEYVYVAPSVTGRIKTLAVVEGDTVKADQFLFDMDSTKQQAAVRAAEAKIGTASANLNNLETGSRDPEIEVIKASLEQAIAHRNLAESALKRTEDLFAGEIVAQAKVDVDRAALEEAEAQVAQLKAQLEVAALPARSAQLLAAQKTLEAAQADADLARSQLDDMTVAAPVEGRIETVYYKAGEVAAAGAPVLSILPPNALKVLFFLPEAERADFALGDQLEMECDGCDTGIKVTISKMASEPQYTPPIIYSREERSRLVFRAEARIPAGATLLPGQPVSLRRVK